MIQSYATYICSTDHQPQPLFPYSVNSNKKQQSSHYSTPYSVRVQPRQYIRPNRAKKRTYPQPGQSLRSVDRRVLILFRLYSSKYSISVQSMKIGIFELSSAILVFLLYVQDRGNSFDFCDLFVFSFLLSICNVLG